MLCCSFSSTPPSFFALICWQHWNEKYLSLQEHKKSTTTFWDIGTHGGRGVCEMDHPRSPSFAIDGSFDHTHYYAKLTIHLCCKQKPAGSSSILVHEHTLWGQSHTHTLCFFMYLHEHTNTNAFAHAGMQTCSMLPRLWAQMFSTAF